MIQELICIVPFGGSCSEPKGTRAREANGTTEYPPGCRVPRRWTLFIGLGYDVYFHARTRKVLPLS